MSETPSDSSNDEAADASAAAGESSDDASTESQDNLDKDPRDAADEEPKADQAKPASRSEAATGPPAEDSEDDVNSEAAARRAAAEAAEQAKQEAAADQAARDQEAEAARKDAAAQRAGTTAVGHTADTDDEKETDDPADGTGKEATDTGSDTGRSAAKEPTAETGADEDDAGTADEADDDAAADTPKDRDEAATPADASKPGTDTDTNDTSEQHGEQEDGVEDGREGGEEGDTAGEQGDHSGAESLREEIGETADDGTQEVEPPWAKYFRPRPEGQEGPDPAEAVTPVIKITVDPLEGLQPVSGDLSPDPDPPIAGDGPAAAAGDSGEETEDAYNERHDDQSGESAAGMADQLRDVPLMTGGPSVEQVNDHDPIRGSISPLDIAELRLPPDAFISPELQDRLVNLEPGTFLILPGFALEGPGAQFADNAELSAGRDIGRHEVRFGHLDMQSWGGDVAVKPFDLDEIAAAANEWGAYGKVNALAAQGDSPAGLTPIGFCRYDDDRNGGDSTPKVGLITLYVPGLVTVKDYALSRDLDSSAGRRQVVGAVQDAAFAHGCLHYNGIAHRDAKDDNMARTGVMPRYIDLEAAAQFGGSDQATYTVRRLVEADTADFIGKMDQWTAVRPQMQELDLTKVYADKYLSVANADGSQVPAEAQLAPEDLGLV